MSFPPENNAALTEDFLLGGRVRLMQPGHGAGYRTGIDPVFLAASVPARAGQRVLEPGCGTAAALACLNARVPGLELVGLELQPAMLKVAHANIAANEMQANTRLFEGDLRRSGECPGEARFDHVMMNPPFVAQGEGSVPPDPVLATAHTEIAGTLADWIGLARRHLRQKGWLTMIHRADRVDEIVAGLLPAFGAISIIALFPAEGQPARRVIVRARLGVNSPAAILPGLVIHHPDGGYSARAESILRGGEALCPV